MTDSLQHSQPTQLIGLPSASTGKHRSDEPNPTMQKHSNWITKWGHATFKNGIQQIVGIGLHDVIAVVMPDAVSVPNKICVQDVKKAVAQQRPMG